MIIEISGKDIKVNNIPGPEGVRGRTSDNALIYKMLKWAPSLSLKEGTKKTFDWINQQVNLKLAISAK